MQKKKYEKRKAENWPELRNGIQLNQKAIFLLLSWTVEKSCI